jgi:predicted cupin superfamily sugar epimerase
VNGSLPAIDSLIERLRLLPHPEGGWYRESYRAAAPPGTRAASTLIYYLLPQGAVSRLHRIDADEGWHLYLGGPLEIHELDDRDVDAAPRVTILGSDLAAGHHPQHVVPAGCWFGAAVAPGAPYALVGCSVAPAFEFGGFELGDRRMLLERFPRARDVILRLT